jgi:WD40 repeat protein
LSFHHHLPHPHLYQRSTHLYFNGTLPTLTVTFINHLQHRFTKAIKDAKREIVVMASAAIEWIGHTGAVNCMSYSPDGCHIVTGSDDKTIRIWDAETGAAVGEPLEGHTGCDGPLLTLPMGGTSSLDLMTRPFESGMPRLVLQLASL